MSMFTENIFTITPDNHSNCRNCLTHHPKLLGKAKPVHPARLYISVKCTSSGRSPQASPRRWERHHRGSSRQVLPHSPGLSPAESHCWGKEYFYPNLNTRRNLRLRRQRGAMRTLATRGQYKTLRLPEDKINAHFQREVHCFTNVL